MRTIILISKTAIFLLFSLSLIAQKPKVNNLFNGKDFKGWQILGGDAKFSIADNAIKLNQKANIPEHTFLATKKKYKDFILELDCKRDSGFYYGILFRAQKAPDTAHVRLYGYQVKVDHNKNRNWTGGIFDDFGNTWNWIYTLEKDTRAQKALKAEGEWDHYRIEVIGDNIKVWVNDIATSNIINTKYDKGFIALKIHLSGNKPGSYESSAWIKNIRIQTASIQKYITPIDIPLVTTY